MTPDFFLIHSKLFFDRTGEGMRNHDLYSIMKTSVYVGVSLDGFIAGRNGDLDMFAPYESREIFDRYLEFIKDIDVIVTGRGTFQKVLSFPEWPYSKRLFVMSKTLKTLPDELRDKVEITPLNPLPLLGKLEQDGFSNISVDGGKVIQSFLREDRIEKLIITRIPILLGEGIPLFTTMDHSLSFTHLETAVLSNGLVSSSYQRTRS